MLIAGSLQLQAHCCLRLVSCHLL
uniref:Uncharacterized protein n=1 Tax=Amphimedon queenslandica TaxID=400682 RepID=A0A1X7VP14_AMPQE